MKKLLLCLLLCGCAAESGTKLAAPINAALGDINTNAQSILKSGAGKQDVRVATIIKDDATAQQKVQVMTVAYTKVVTTVASKDHRIFIDNCIFGAIALALLAPILIKLIPFLIAL